MITDYNNTCSIHNRHYKDEKYSVIPLINILEVYNLLSINRNR